MFEDSTFESTGRLRSRSRGWMPAAFLFNGSILLALILIPLIYPEALPRQMMSILLEAPPPPPQPPTPVQQPREKFHGLPELDGAALVAPPTIPRFIKQFEGPEASAPGGLLAMDPGPEPGIAAPMRRTTSGHRFRSGARERACPPAKTPVAGLEAQGVAQVRLALEKEPLP